MDKLIYESVPTKQRPAPKHKPLPQTATVSFRGGQSRVMPLRSALMRALSDMKAQLARQR